MGAWAALDGAQMISRPTVKRPRLTFLGSPRPLAKSSPKAFAAEQLQCSAVPVPKLLVWDHSQIVDPTLTRFVIDRSRRTSGGAVAKRWPVGHSDSIHNILLDSPPI